MFRPSNDENEKRKEVIVTEGRVLKRVPFRSMTLGFDTNLFLLRVSMVFNLIS